MENQLLKKNRIENQSIILNGFLGTGKSLLCPVLSSMVNIGRSQNVAAYEYIYILREFKKIDTDASNWLIHTLLDLTSYYSAIGRQINLRWSDDTGLRNSPSPIQDILSLFSQGGDDVIKEIEKHNKATSLMTHNLMLCPESLIELHDKNVYFIELIRHPIFLYEHYKNFLERFDTSKEFTPSFYYQSVKIPWFAYSQKKEFISGNLSEKVLICINHSFKSYFLNKDKLVEKINLLDISLEDIIFKTDLSLNKISNFLGKPFSKKTKSILKKQKIPRKSLIDGKFNKNYGSKLKTNDDFNYCKSIIDLIKSNVSPKLFIEFLEVVSKYQKSYPSIVNSYTESLLKEFDL